MKKVSIFILLVASALTSMAEKSHTIKLQNGGAVTVEAYGDGIVRIVKTPEGEEYSKNSLAITAKPSNLIRRAVKAADTTFITLPSMQIAVSIRSGEVHFKDQYGKEIAAESGSATFIPTEDAGRPTYRTEQKWRLPIDQDIYGLGILQNGKMSQRGESRTLRPGNTEDGIPFFQTDSGWGIYWDNYSPTDINDDGTGVSFAAEVGDAVDYYFIYGGDADGVIAGIRELTGSVPMAPLWAYGFMQSRERYKTQEQLLEVLRKYRKDGVPIDVMIQDWQYWGSNYTWNAMEFLSEWFDDAQGMIDEVHDSNAKIMISVWSSFGPMTKQYRELEPLGLLFDIDTWPQSGVSHVWPPVMEYPSGVKVYDCYSPLARDIYWSHLRGLYDMGINGWWMDSTEPDHFDMKPIDFDHMTDLGTYRTLVGAYPISTVGGVYEHQRATSDTTRVFILTRSATFGQQRTGANTWSGDVGSNWENLRKQITGGLNFSLTGNPNYNSDLGGFFSGSYNGKYHGKPGYENPAFRELYARWTQQGVFTPMMRSHGADTPREFYYYGHKGEPIYDALVGAVKLRYRLLPYIYSTAWQVSKNNDTFMRALVMDFPNDPKAKEQTGEYMFGRSILATPVLDVHYTPETADLENIDFTQKVPHTVYLPAGTDWYYYHTGQKYTGGQEVTLQLPLGEVPFFVKAGSILPIGPDVQWSSQKPWDNLEIRVYPGADGKFTLYEDAGDGYGYEKGQYTEIDMIWNDATQTLVIPSRKGKFNGMLKQHKFNVVFPDGRKIPVVYKAKVASVKRH